MLLIPCAIVNNKAAITPTIDEFEKELKALVGDSISLIINNETEGNATTVWTKVKSLSFGAKEMSVLIAVEKFNFMYDEEVREADCIGLDGRGWKVLSRCKDDFIESRTVQAYSWKIR